MRALWILLFVGSSVAMVTVDKGSSMEDFTDDELVDISEREPDTVDEQGTEDENKPDEDSGDEEWDQNCRNFEDQKQNVDENRLESAEKGNEDKYDDGDDSNDDSNDDDDDDDDDDDNKDYGLKKRHHHRHHHHHHHHKHHRHRKHGGREICRRQFCGCKKRAGKDCRQVMRCFMRLAFCVRRRRCHHMRRVESKWKDAFQPTGEPDPTRRPHPRRQCVKNFKECMNGTARGDCKAKLKCIIKLKHCMRSGNWSHPTTPPHPTPKESEQLDDFQDEELVEVPDEDSLLDEERHGNHTGRGFCRNEFRRCENRTGEDCRKKFHCFIRLAHCVRCSHGHHRKWPFHHPIVRIPFGSLQRRGYKGPWKRPKKFGIKRQRKFGGFIRPGGFGGFKRPGGFGGFKRPGGFGDFKRHRGFGGFERSGRFGGFKRSGRFGGFKRPGFKIPLGANAGYKRYGQFSRFIGAGKFAGVKKSWKWRHNHEMTPWHRRRPTHRPQPSERPTPSKRCKQEVDACLKKAGAKDCSKKFKCYFAFLHCLRREWRPIRGPV